MPLVEAKLPDNTKIALLNLAFGDDYDDASDNKDSPVPIVLGISIPLEKTPQDSKEASDFSREKFSSIVDLLKCEEDENGSKHYYVDTAPPGKPERKVYVELTKLLGDSLARYTLAIRALQDSKLKIDALADTQRLSADKKNAADISKPLLRARENFLPLADQYLGNAQCYTTEWKSNVDDLLNSQYFTEIKFESLTRGPVYDAIYKCILDMLDSEKSLTPAERLLQNALIDDYKSFLSREATRYKKKNADLKRMTSDLRDVIRIFSALHFIEESAGIFKLWSDGYSTLLYPGDIFNTLSILLKKDQYRQKIIDAIKTIKPDFNATNPFQWLPLKVSVHDKKPSLMIVEQREPEKKADVILIHDLTGKLDVYHGLREGLHEYAINTVERPQIDEQFENLILAAKYHGDGILKIQTQGPYYLVDYSHPALGTAIAEYLKQKGCEVHLIVIDAFAPSTLVEFSHNQYAEYLSMIMSSAISQLASSFDCQISLTPDHLTTLENLTKEKQIEKLADLIIAIPAEVKESEPFQRALKTITSNLSLGLTYQPGENKLDNVVGFYSEQLARLARKLNLDMTLGWSLYTDDVVNLTYINGGSTNKTIMVEDKYVQKVLRRLTTLLSPNSPRLNAEVTVESTPESVSPQEAMQLAMQKVAEAQKAMEQAMVQMQQQYDHPAAGKPSTPASPPKKSIPMAAGPTTAEKVPTTAAGSSSRGRSIDLNPAKVLQSFFSDPAAATKTKQGLADANPETLLFRSLARTSSTP